MRKVERPELINEIFASAINEKDMELALSLYEENARLLVDESGRSLDGKAAIRAELEQLMQVPGRMTSINRFCVEHHGLALLRADYSIVHDGQIVVSGFTAELARQQPDGTWRYVIDHAGASCYGT